MLPKRAGDALNKPFIVIGSGVHAKVVLDLLLERGEQVICLADIDKNKTGSFILGVEVMEEIDVLDKYKFEIRPKAHRKSRGITSRIHRS